jgi:hypothetical protein
VHAVAGHAVPLWSDTLPLNALVSRAIAGSASCISGVAIMVASSPWKNAVSPPPGCDDPSMITRPISIPSRGSFMVSSIGGWPSERNYISEAKLVVRPHRGTLERALANAGIPLQVAAEADGCDLLVHFASLGVGATIVNGCVGISA